MTRACLLVLPVLAAAACGASGRSPTLPTTPAALTLSMTPDPIVEDATCLCGGLPNRVATIGRLTIRETAGTAVRLDSLRVTLRNGASGATTFTNAFTQADIGGHAQGQTRVAARGSLEVIDVGGHYDRSVSGSGTLTIEVGGTDDGGRAVSATLTVAVVPASR